MRYSVQCVCAGFKGARLPHKFLTQDAAPIVGLLLMLEVQSIVLWHIVFGCSSMSLARRMYGLWPETRQIPNRKRLVFSLEQGVKFAPIAIVPLRRVSGFCAILTISTDATAPRHNGSKYFDAQLSFIFTRRISRPDFCAEIIHARSCAVPSTGGIRDPQGAEFPVGIGRPQECRDPLWPEKHLPSRRGAALLAGKPFISTGSPTASSLYV